jgi:hypothetical protein
MHTTSVGEEQVQAKRKHSQDHDCAGVRSVPVLPATADCLLFLAPPIECSKARYPTERSFGYPTNDGSDFDGCCALQVVTLLRC